VRTYLLLAAAEIRRYSTYRLAILAGVTTQSVFGFIRVSVLFGAISSAGGTLAGYNQQLASTYVWLGQALLAPIALFAWIDIAERVSSGDIAVDFARPVDLQLAWWARDLGRASFQLLARGLPPLFIGAVTIGLALPDSWSAYPLGVMSLFLAISISFTLRFLVNLIAFWTFDVRGFIGLYVVIVGPFSGLIDSSSPLSEMAANHGLRHAISIHVSDTDRRAVRLGSRLGRRRSRCQPARMAARPRRPGQSGAVAGRPSTGGAGWLNFRPARFIGSSSAPGSAASWPIGPASG
jgi:ABC-2 type transport system permease protein